MCNLNDKGVMSETVTKTGLKKDKLAMVSKEGLSLICFTLFLPDSYIMPHFEKSKLVIL